MQIVYDGIINKDEGSVISALAVNCGLSFATARLLYCRKIDTEEKTAGRPEKADDQKSEKTIQNKESMS